MQPMTLEELTTQRMSRGQVYTHNYSGYRRGCRCDTCKADVRRYDTMAKHRRRELLKEDPSLVQHGTAYAYEKWMCRCDLCYVANSENMKRLRQRRGGIVTDYRRRRVAVPPFGREWLDD